MQPPPAEVLRTLLDLARETRASAVHLASGCVPQLVVNGTLRDTQLAPMRANSVFALHEECALRADREDLSPAYDCEYLVSFTSHGTWRCQATFPDVDATLTLSRSDGDPQYETSPRRPLPSLNAKASVATGSPEI